MRGDAVTVHVGSGVLRAVPAVHYRIFSARPVYRLCAEENSRPAAVAVELGPETAGYVSQWMNELTANRDRLPVMLGVLKKNRLIRPSMRERALRLQERSGCDLSELPPDVLRREIQFAPDLVVPLSPTDSIIEAVRCASVYHLPLYGVDLEETATSDRRSVCIEFPRARQTLAGHVTCVAGAASHLPTVESDMRREVAMAARLKTLIARHGDVLFTCGLAHWNRLERLLRDPDVRPAPVPEDVSHRPGGFRRLVIDPQMAARYMDLFPAASLAWESRRGKDGLSDPSLLLRKIFNRAYKRHFCGSHRKGPGSAPQADGLELCRDFEAYLRNLALLEGVPAPDMYLALSAAQDILGSAFRRVLSEAFMKYPWVNPEEFPECGYLSDPEREDDGLELQTGAGREMVYAPTPKPVGRPMPPNPANSDLTPSPDESLVRSSGFSWLPWDRLVTSASVDAVLASQRHPARRVVVFGSGESGRIDVKATLRSRSRGEHRVFVQERFQEPIPPEEVLEGFPVVWLFTDHAPSNCSWITQMFSAHVLRPHARDKERFDRVVGSGYVLPLVGFGTRESKELGLGIQREIFSGAVVYHPSCFTNRQHVRWLERTDYRRVPIGDTSAPGLAAAVQERTGLDILQYHWTSGLILCALPFASKAVTVVAPEAYRFEEVVLQTARRLDVTLYKTPLNRYSPQRRKALARCHYAPCITLEPMCLYSEGVERVIGESQHTHRELVPRQVLDFAAPT